MLFELTTFYASMSSFICGNELILKIVLLQISASGPLIAESVLASRNCKARPFVQPLSNYSS